jgi:hypothetical protein
MPKKVISKDSHRVRSALFTTANMLKEPKCLPTDEWMNKTVHTYNEISSNDKKEWSTNTCYNMDEPWKHYSKWNKLDIKGYILHDSLWGG